MSFIGRIATSASQDRLESLIEERLKPGADKKRIDARIWDLFGENWAVMFTDLAGFSRRVAEFGIIHFLQTIHEAQRLLVPCIERHDGILLKTEGDSLLVIFRSAARALECALAMQRTARDYNRERDDAEQVLLCVGLGCGRLLRIGDHDVFGAEVNAAAKLGEDTAKAWEILVTGAVRQLAQEARDAGSFPEPVGFEALPDAPPGAEAAFRVTYRL
ncbi:MAG: adenylate cyclase [Spirochaetes bacterium RBG_16_67_19]|nr:MAG: adenylate cyclase [Spirochaetes bacterium GWB1_66_5]OHD72957.1 MAG: adenylate cyclase [Spirochaetes bacterium RBG_16_67_19]